MEAIFSESSPQNRIVETSIRHKNSEKGPTFPSKIPERIDIETIQWHTPVRKYHKSPPPPGVQNLFLTIEHETKRQLLLVV